MSRGAANPLGADRGKASEKPQGEVVLWVPDKWSRNPLAGERSLTQGSYESGGNRETPHQVTDSCIHRGRSVLAVAYNRPPFGVSYSTMR